MKTTITEENKFTVMYLEGRLDTAASVDVEQDMQVLMTKAKQDIIFDCSQLEYISSSGLRLFLNVLKDSYAKGNKVFVRGMNEDIRNVFDMTGFTNLFPIMP